MAEMVRVNIRITKELYDYYKQLSERNGVPMSTLMMMDLEKQREKSKESQK